MNDSLINDRLVQFMGGAGVIEGRLANDTSHKYGALVTLHPHPLYGGSMDNNVVGAVVRAGQDAGFITLRFNFRGVGRSQGGYDHGVGEQDDVRAALDFLGRRFRPETKVLVGYSFGACIALAYCHRQDHGIDRLFLICPPPSLLQEDLSLGLPVVKQIVLSENDEIAPPEEVKARLPASRAEELIKVIPGADHFLFGKEKEIEDILATLLGEFSDAS